METLGRVKTLTGHTDAVRALAVSNGRLFSGSYDGTVKVGASCNICDSLMTELREQGLRVLQAYSHSAGKHQPM